MAEKANQLTEAIRYRNRKLASELKTTTMVETTALSSTSLLKSKLLILSSKLSKKRTETSQNYDRELYSI